MEKEITHEIHEGCGKGEVCLAGTRGILVALMMAVVLLAIGRAWAQVGPDLEQGVKTLWFVSSRGPRYGQPEQRESVLWRVVDVVPAAGLARLSYRWTCSENHNKRADLGRRRLAQTLLLS
jgi:hypothetical protein